RYGIPEYRLPKKVLDREIGGILNTGISSYCGQTLGIDFTVSSLLREGYDAIFMGIGAWSDYNLGVEGEDLKGCWQGINFLSSIASGKKLSIGKKVAVVGGGNSAIDCVRTLVRLGADEVTIVYRRTRNEMPANEVEIQAAEHENINFKFLAAPLRVIGNEDGHVTHLEYLKMELGEPDASGRRRPVPIEGSESKLEIDMLITAIGQRPKVDFVENEDDGLQDLTLTRWNTIDSNLGTFQSNIPYIFTAGDCATGPALVVDAIGGARKAVSSIHRYLSAEAEEEERSDEKVLAEETGLLMKGSHIQESIFDCVPGIKSSPRTPMPELPVNERINSMEEVDLVISEESAIYESGRCLECCRVCYNKDAT
ncbi:MAG: FAD-dependent oxidoreductase, partial [bacterium]|nr:FAD-dependent oxidoreductase [bacterium]